MLKRALPWPAFGCSFLQGEDLVLPVWVPLGQRETVWKAVCSLGLPGKMLDLYLLQLETLV